MPWDQFYAAGFQQIDICDRTTKDDLRLDVAEDLGACGIVAGARDFSASSAESVLQEPC